MEERCGAVEERQRKGIRASAGSEHGGEGGQASRGEAGVRQPLMVAFHLAAAVVVKEEAPWRRKGTDRQDGEDNWGGGML